MTMSKFSRLMEAVKRDSQIIQVRKISKDWDEFNPNVLGRILSLEYDSNHVGLVKAKKWIAKIFKVFEDEVEKLYQINNDIGDAIYLLDVSKESDCDYSLNQIISLIESRDSFDTIKEVTLSLSALERKWFFRYLIKQPNNRITENTVKKILAKKHNKKLGEVNTHCNFNTIGSVVSYYSMGKEPPMNLVHGVFVSPMLAKRFPMEEWPSEQIIHYKYGGKRIQIHKQGDSIILFDRMGKVINTKYPTIIEGIDYDIDNYILDGEIYSVDKFGSPSNNGAYVLVIIDVLKVNGVITMSMSLENRLQKISHLSNVAKQSTDDVLAFYNCALADGFHGVIIKDSTKEYACSKKEWIDYSPRRMDLDVVITGANTKLTNFTIAVKSSNGFIDVGTIHTGFNKEQLTMLDNKLRRLVVGLVKDKYSFLPKVVLSVKAKAIVRLNNGNIVLKQPQLVDIQNIFVQDINTIDDVLQMMVGI